MIIVNGTVEWRLAPESGPDPETGYPVRREDAWGDPVPCQFVPARVNRLAMAAASGERYTDLNFTILIEEGSEVGTFLRLRDPFGNTVGEFPLAGAEPLHAVGQIRLTV